MKSTGIVRRIDELGRIVLPIEIRKTFGISCKDSIEIFTDVDKIVREMAEKALIDAVVIEDKLARYAKIDEIMEDDFNTSNFIFCVFPTSFKDRSPSTIFSSSNK